LIIWRTLPIEKWMEGGLWHPESILIPMQIAIDENILTQGLLF